MDGWIDVGVIFRWVGVCSGRSLIFYNNSFIVRL